ncbi:hypothetical protein MHPYR_590006 [uncultured Mycobacterium sp.]|uniref:Uncharacterized protein n=1 Tax=uncultured Mycobacterium sp. TaxID=171292 RepID=A0A1Y5PMB4_9MYCO|nr:hypothetical protein MHPYR_590006 [uncultured Mycobacterium sp.]
MPLLASIPNTNEGLGVHGNPPTTFLATFGTQLAEWHEVADDGGASEIVAPSNPHAITGTTAIFRIPASCRSGRPSRPDQRSAATTLSSRLCPDHRATIPAN